jgi:hypothetical protein
VGLPNHLVAGETRARFADWPEVTFTGFDRREALALDIETIGWANTMV